jgi:predicted PurR-regulated permease PerM
VDAVPGYVEDLTAGRGRLGFLERDYHITERVRDALSEGGASKVLGLSGTAVAVTKGVVTAVVAVLTIAFLTFFMLLEGPKWVERLYSLLPEEKQSRWRGIGDQIYRTVGGYVTGNLLISLIAGIASTGVLTILGVPYALALGLLVAILDLIPLAGATIAAVAVSTVAFLDSVQSGIIVLIFFIVYQQLENHVLQPIVYGRTVQLSPLAVLIAVLIGAELAGVVGALAAIPVAGTIQVILVDWLAHRRPRQAPPGEPTPT